MSWLAPCMVVTAVGVWMCECLAILWSGLSDHWLEKLCINAAVQIICLTVYRSLQMMMKSLYCGGTEGVSLSYADAMKVIIWAWPASLEEVLWNPSVPKHDPGQQRQDLPDCQGQWTMTPPLYHSRAVAKNTFVESKSRLRTQLKS